MDADQKDSHFKLISDHLPAINERVAGGKCISYIIYISIEILTSYKWQPQNSNSWLILFPKLHYGSSPTTYHLDHSCKEKIVVNMIPFFIYISLTSFICNDCCRNIYQFLQFVSSRCN